MAFKLGDIIIDRISIGVAEDFSGKLLYTLTQLVDGSIETTATSKDAVDKDGTLVKRFWTGKTGTFTANNAMLNLPILGSISGSEPELASAGKKIVMPRIIQVNATETTVTLNNAVEGSIKVHGIDNTGAMGKEYTKDAEAGADKFAFAENTLTLPVGSGETKYIIKYNRNVEAGAAIRNRADKFPQTIRLTLKVLAVDPCHADTLKAGYVYMPSFQPSPEATVSLTTDAQLAYSGDLQVDYCGSDKTLYEFYWADEDEDEE